METQKSRKLSRLASTLLAASTLFAFPVLTRAQTPPTTTTPAKKPVTAPVKTAVVQPKVVAPVKPPVTPPKVAATPVQPAVTAATPPSGAATTVQPVPATPVATTNKQPVSTIAQPTVVKTTSPTTTTAHPATTPAAGTGTLTWGTVVYSPAGCVHNGTKAVCTFTLANQGNAVTLQAAYQMYTMQFVDDAHVPHAADTAYFVDNYGTRQAQLFVNNGEGGTLIREFPNVNDQVASGEFHLANQVVGGVSVGAPSTIPTQGTAVANTPVQPAVQPVAANTTATDPTSQVQQGINQVNDKKQKAKSLWDQMKAIKK